MVNQKQIALLLCSVAMVLMCMSGFAILMTASLRTELTEKFDLQQKLIDKLTNNQLAMLPLLDPERGQKPAGISVDHADHADQSEQSTDDVARAKIKPEMVTPQLQAPGEQHELVPILTPANPQTNIGISVPDDTILALASPLSLPPIVTPKMVLIQSGSELEPAVAHRKPPQVLENVDGILVQKIVSNWHRPPSARDGMSVSVVIKMERDGRLKSAKVTKTSGDKYFDQSAIDAIMAVQKIPEMKQVSDGTYKTLYRERNVDFSPEALSG